MSKLNVYILHKDRTTTFHRIGKADIANGKFMIQGNEYYIASNNIFLRDTGLIFKKQRRYMFFNEGYPEAIPMPADEKVTQMLIRTKVVNDFLAPEKQDWTMALILMAMGIMMGMLIMVAIYPHVFLQHAATTTATAKTGNTTVISAVIARYGKL